MWQLSLTLTVVTVIVGVGVVAVAAVVAAAAASASAVIVVASYTLLFPLPTMNPISAVTTATLLLRSINNIFGAAVQFWGQTTQNLSGLSPQERDCTFCLKRVNSSTAILPQLQRTMPPHDMKSTSTPE